MIEEKEKYKAFLVVPEEIDTQTIDFKEFENCIEKFVNSVNECVEKQDDS